MNSEIETYILERRINVVHGNVHTCSLFIHLTKVGINRGRGGPEKIGLTDIIAIM